jgi:hypothetical protein
VLVGQRLELPLLDETALGGLLEQALGRRQVVQMNSLAQLSAFPCGRAAELAASAVLRRAGLIPRDVPEALSEL